MAEQMTSENILTALALPNNDQSTTEFTTSGIVPMAIANAEISKTAVLMGITPDDFSKRYSSPEFDFNALKIVFKEYCKDFTIPLAENIPSKSLEFSAKMLFEYGPYIRSEKKGRGDKAIRFKFPYKRDVSGNSELSIRVVIVTTFKDMRCCDTVVDGKMILTFRQAGLLAMVTFSDAIAHCYMRSQSKLLTPICGAIFSRDSIAEMSTDLGIEEINCLKIINDSSTSGGQYLPNSDIACAIVCVIAATKKVTDKNVRDSIITKTVKQYIHQKKEYSRDRFIIFAKYALGGVPPGLDAGTLIELFNETQTKAISARARVTAITQATGYPRTAASRQASSLYSDDGAGSVAGGISEGATYPSVPARPSTGATKKVVKK